MLTLMRQLLRSKIFGGLVFGIVILGMAVWGVEDIFSGGSGQNVVTAGERGVTLTELNERYEDDLERYRIENETNVTRKQGAELGLLSQTIGQQAFELSMLGYARSLGADATDDAVISLIEDDPNFKDASSDRFSRAQLDRYLAFNRKTNQQFEEETRDRLTMFYLQTSLGSGLQAPDVLARIQAVVESETRRFVWLTLSSDNLEDIPAPTEDEAREYFEANINRFQIPERRQLAIVAISPDAFVDLEAVTDEEIEQVYELQKDTVYAGDGERVVTEALFASKDAADEAFALLAVGGDINNRDGLVSLEEKQITKEEVPFLTVGQQQALSDVMFGAGVAQSAMFGPYDYNGNWLVYRIEEVVAGEPRPLDDEVRAEIAEGIALNNARSVFRDASLMMDDLILLGEEPEVMAERLGVDVIRFAPTDAQGRTREGGFEVDLVQTYTDGFRQAFTELFEGDQSERFDKRELSYLVTLETVFQSEVPDFEDVKDDVIAALAAQNLQTAFEQTAADIEARINGGESTFDQEAERFGTEAQRTIEGASRANLSEVAGRLPNAALQGLFEAEEGGFVSVQGNTATERVIARLDSISVSDPQVTEDISTRLKGAIQNNLEQDLREAFVQALQTEFGAEQDSRAINGLIASIENGN